MARDAHEDLDELDKLLTDPDLLGDDEEIELVKEPADAAPRASREGLKAVVEASPVLAANPAAGGQDAVAGHHDRDRVLAERVADRARSGWLADLAGDPAVGAPAAARHARGRLQHRAGERRDRAEVDRQLEPPAAACEV